VHWLGVHAADEKQHARLHRAPRETSQDVDRLFELLSRLVELRAHEARAAKRRAIAAEASLD
jgi:hypothetical protein